MRLPYELFLALRYLRFHRGRAFLSIITLISVTGVTVGTGVMVGAMSLSAGLVQDVRNRIHSGSAHLTVMSTEDDTFDAAATVMSRIETVPGVVTSGAVLHSPAMVTLPDMDRTGFAEVFGIEPERHARVVLHSPESAARFGRLNEPTPSGRAGILLGEHLAARVGAIEGDLIRVLVPQVELSPWAPTPRSRLFEVVGTYSSDHYQEDTRRAYVHVDHARRLLRAGERTSWIELRIEDLTHLDEMKSALRDELGSRWLVVDLIEQNEDLLRALNLEKFGMFVVIGLIVVVAALNIVSTLVLMVTGKVKEIGTLTAMGARPPAIALIFVLQGLIIGVAGTVSGVVLGSVVSILMDRYRVITLDPEVYYLTYLPFAPRPFDLAVVATAAVAISLLATIYPAVKAAQLDPVEALRHE